MPGAEDDGHGLSIVSLQSSNEIANPFYPRLELLMLRATFQHAFHHGRVGDIPCSASRQRIAGVPAEGDDASSS